MFRLETKCSMVIIPINLSSLQKRKLILVCKYFGTIVNKYHVTQQELRFIIHLKVSLCEYMASIMKLELLFTNRMLRKLLLIQASDILFVVREHFL